MGKELTYQAFNQQRQVLGEVLPNDMPLGITIHVTNLCNFKCFYCSASQSVEKRKQDGLLLRHMPLQGFKECIDSIAQAGRVSREGIMSAFTFQNAALSGLRLITPFCAEDGRGFFLKSFERDIYRENGVDTQGFEVFYTNSVKGTVRGLHFQRAHSQDKLVQVLRGAAYDVAVDLRRGSETFGKWESFYLTAENRQMVYIPKGFAHGFLALEEGTLFSYLCGDRYDPETDGGIRWNDPQLAVQWPLERVEKTIVSEKDAALPSLREFVERYGALSGGGDTSCGC